MKIIFKIKEIRIEKNLSLKEVAKKATVSATHINDIENQLKMPSLEVMVLIAKALNKNIQELYKIEW